MNWDFVAAFTVIILIFALGDIISGLTRGKVPGVFAVSVCLIIGFWTIFPKDILAIGKFTAIFDITGLLILIHVGTLLDIQQMKREWRTVLTTLGAILGLTIFVGIVTIPLFGLQTFAAVIPPLSGGGIAAMIMTEAANAKGLTQLAVLAIMMLLTQSFLAAPLTANALKKEAKRLIGLFRNGEIAVTVEANIEEEKISTKKLIERIPEKLKTPAVHLGILAILASINTYLIAPYIGDFISPSLSALFLGVIAGELGLVDKSPLQKADSFGILMIGFFAGLMGGLSNATPDVLLSLIKPIVVSLVIAVVGVYVFSRIIGKKLGFSKDMAFAIGLNCFLGFPMNYMLTEEAVKFAADGEEEHEFLMSKMLPNMLVSGFVSVSIVSVIIAGIFTKIM